MPASPLTFAEFKEEIGKRLDSSVSKADINKVMGALVEEAQDCLINGYVVSIPGLVKLTPVVKAGRKKGTIVRNPFEGTEKTLRADEPDKFAVKVGKSSALGKRFPSLKTNAGKELHRKLKRR